MCFSLLLLDRQSQLQRLASSSGELLEGVGWLGLKFGPDERLQFRQHIFQWLVCIDDANLRVAPINFPQLSRARSHVTGRLGDFAPYRDFRIQPQHQQQVGSHDLLVISSFGFQQKLHQAIFGCAIQEPLDIRPIHQFDLRNRLAITQYQPPVCRKPASPGIKAVSVSRGANPSQQLQVPGEYYRVDLVQGTVRPLTFE